MNKNTAFSNMAENVVDFDPDSDIENFEFLNDLDYDDVPSQPSKDSWCDGTCTPFQ